MSNFDLEIEWIEPPSDKEPDFSIPEYKPTWASLRIKNGSDDYISRFYDHHSESVRNSINLPLYPLAEWIAFNWWNLLYETITPGRINEESYSRRHSLKYAREGYALPNLQVTPAGDKVNISWDSQNLENYKIEFLDSGDLWVESHKLEDELTSFLDAVDNRLSEQNIEESDFQQIWNSIKTGTTEETEFCKATARLGLSPYDVTEEQEEMIICIAETLSEELYESFFGVASIEEIRNQAQKVTEAIEELQKLEVKAEQLVSLREEFSKSKRKYLPWEEGYQYARELREYLGEDQSVFHTTEDVAETFFLKNGSCDESLNQFDSNRLFDALVSPTKTGAPGFAIDKRRDESKKFAFCRGMYEYLNSSNGKSHLVTREQNNKQKINRAFAAEFLVPARMLKERVTDEYLDEEELENIAEEFGVSQLIIQHQLKNHNIVEGVAS